MKKREHDRLLYIWEKAEFEERFEKKIRNIEKLRDDEFIEQYVCGTHSRISFCNVDSSKLGNRNFNWKI